MKHGDTYSKRRQRVAFTLVELLVVIAIMAIVVAITIPAFRGLGRGAGAEGAITQLRTTLSLARQWAVTHRQRTYVVFPDRAINYSGIENQLYKACKAYAVLAASGDARQGRYIKEWTFLPQGVVFDDSDRPQSVFKDDCVVTNVPFPDAAHPRDICCIVFKPDGTPVSRGALAIGYEVFLREGWALVNTNTWTLDYGTNSVGMNRGVEVTGLIGGIKLHDYQQKY
ncbi:MAG: prepilin-type N-terminal cleavage/methylation domain-containing protein [Verrucomicrobiota bacterium]